jgi:hypothetical protein
MSDAISHPVSLSDKARAAHEEHMKRVSSESEKHIARRQSAAKKELTTALKRLFGDHVEPSAIVFNHAPVPARCEAILSDFPRVRFSIPPEGHGDWNKVYMHPVLDVPDDDPSYNNWWENLANSSRPRSRGVSTLSDVGAVLKEWDTADWIIKPWPPKPQVVVTKTRFAAHDIDALNEETRPFKVLGVGTDTYFMTAGTSHSPIVVIIQYTDVDM